MNSKYTLLGFIKAAAAPQPSIDQRRATAAGNAANIQARDAQLGSLQDPRPQIPDRPAVAPRRDAMAPITMADLDKVDSKTMQKYYKLTGARDMNSKMDRWKTLMAARYGKKWDMYSNAAYRAWEAQQRQQPQQQAQPQRQGLPPNQLTFGAPVNLTANPTDVGSMTFPGDPANHHQSTEPGRRLNSQANEAGMEARNHTLGQLGDPMPQIPDRPATAPRRQLTPTVDEAVRSIPGLPSWAPMPR